MLYQDNVNFERFHFVIDKLQLQYCDYFSNNYNGPFRQNTSRSDMLYMYVNMIAN